MNEDSRSSLIRVIQNTYSGLGPGGVRYRGSYLANKEIGN